MTGPEVEPDAPLPCELLDPPPEDEVRRGMEHDAEQAKQTGEGGDS